MINIITTFVSLNDQGEKMSLLIKNIFLLLISLFVFSTANKATDMPSCQETTQIVVSSYEQEEPQLTDPINYLTDYQLTIIHQNCCNYQNTTNSFKQKNIHRNHKHINHTSENYHYPSKIKKDFHIISYHPLDYYIYTLEKIIT